MENNKIKKLEDNGLSAFSNSDNFELAQRVASMLSKSDLVPKEYKGNIANCVIALNIANRIGADPLMVMQNLDIIYGRPSWSSTFLISAINSCGKYEPLRFELKNKGIKKFKYTIYVGVGQNRKALTKELEIEDKECFAWTKDKKGVKLEGTSVTTEMVLSEGWYDKEGSKWKTMFDLMIRYRSASFFSRLYCPEVTMGMQTYEEVVDVVNDYPEEVKIEVIEEKKKDLKGKEGGTTQGTLL
jgi:hypothetical protein